MSAATGSRRPAESAFKQQKLKAWQPILSPKWVISSFFGVGAVFIPIGISILLASGQVLQATVQYDEQCKTDMITWDATPPNPGVCEIKFTLSDDSGWEEKDVYAYYQLDNFYQNHRRYVQSRAATQLTGEKLDFESTNTLTSDKSTGECTGFFDKYQEADASGQETGTEVFMYPCGLVAASMFNDTLSLRNSGTGEYVQWNDANKHCMTNGTVGEPCPTNPEGVAWPSDVDKKYASPGIDWIKRNCRYIGGQDISRSGFIHPDIATMLAQGKLEKYPVKRDCGMPVCGHRVLNDDMTPNDGIYNCWHNVTDEDLIVWMRVAALPSFKKLYRKIPKGVLKKNTEYVLVVRNHFPVAEFKGSKTFVLSTTSWIGGRNDFLGYTYLVVGGICVLLSIIFLGKHMASPRIMGDPRYLNWK